MEALIRSRGVIKGRVTSFKTYITKLSSAHPDSQEPLDEVTKLEIWERVYRIREAFERFEQIQSNIEEATENLDEALEYRETFEDEYFHIIAQAEALRSRGAINTNASHINEDNVNANTPLLENTNGNVKTSRMSASRNEPSSSQTSVNRDTSIEHATNLLSGVTMAPNQNIIYKAQGIRLPTIELPKFSGEVAEWLSFRDTFESLIHKNGTIDLIQKFHYLKASLEGSAAQIIKSLEFTAVNYNVAWETICNRFNNQRLLTHKH